MTPITGEEYEELLKTFEREAIHLETRKRHERP